MRVAPLLSIPLALGLVPAWTFPHQTGEPGAGAEPPFAAIDAYVTDQMRSAQLPGVALVVVRGDRVVYAKGYGKADPAGRPVTPATPFLLGSISKPFTALAVMQLVEAGKVELDAPVQRYIPWFRVADSAASATITVRQMLYQRSGLPQSPTTQAITDQGPDALEHAVRALATLEPFAPPGTAFAYSNGNYDTLGMLVQAVSGQSYEEYVRQHIFAPLDMRNSFASQDEAMRHGMASGYRWWFGIPVASTLPFDRADLPSGYLIASAEDMAHFVIAQMNGGRYGAASVLSPEGIALTHVIPRPDPYGMGWEAEEDNGLTLINHDGGTPNFQTSLFFDPEARVGVFIAANVCGALDIFASPPGLDFRDGSTLRAMAHSVLNLAAGRPLPDQGIGHRTLYVAYDLVLLVLTGVLIVFLTRMPERRRRIEERGVSRASDLVWRGAKAAVLHLALPVILVVLAVSFPGVKVALTLYQPDLVYWLVAVAAVLLVKGLFEVLFLWRAFTESHRRRALQAAY